MNQWNVVSVRKTICFSGKTQNRSVYGVKICFFCADDRMCFCQQIFSVYFFYCLNLSGLRFCKQYWDALSKLNNMSMNEHVLYCQRSCHLVLEETRSRVQVVIFSLTQPDPVTSLINFYGNFSFCSLSRFRSIAVDVSSRQLTVHVN